jgi:hypothetical protein
MMRITWERCGKSRGGRQSRVSLDREVAQKRGKGELGPNVWTQVVVDPEIARKSR